MRGIHTVKDIIGIMSGTSGVGKSTLTGLIAVELARRGYRVGILDADVTQPGIPAFFGLEDIKVGNPAMDPIITSLGIKVMSPCFWDQQAEESFFGFRPMVGRLVKLFWMPIEWGNLDYLLIDLPPMSEKLPFRLLEALPLSGVVTIYSPREKGGILVKQALRMAEKAGHARFGLIENNNLYSSKSSCRAPAGHGSRVADITGTNFLGSLPFDQALNSCCTQGSMEDYSSPYLTEMVEALNLIIYLSQVKKIAEV